MAAGVSTPSLSVTKEQAGGTGKERCLWSCNVEDACEKGPEGPAEALSATLLLRLRVDLQLRPPLLRWLWLPAERGGWGDRPGDVPTDSHVCEIDDFPLRDGVSEGSREAREVRTTGSEKTEDAGLSSTE
jgi:hypothetical protein